MNTFTEAQEDRFWQALERRDRSARGAFVVAVRTTGIYCTPGCPARLPYRRNVQFFATPEAAELGGFRACLRCKPREAPAQNPSAARVRRACAALGDSTREEHSVESLAKEVRTTPDRLRRDFAAVLGISPREYADAIRMRRFKGALREGKDITGSLYEAGYGSSRGLYERTPRQLGMTPGHYRSGGRGLEIRYVTAASPLGRVLVAGTERGVCFIALARPEREMLAALREEFPQAKMRPGGSDMKSWTEFVLSLARSRTPSGDLPMALRATAFQWRVWKELARIPAGETRSYSEVARSIGQPKAARAVARACATNPAAVVIPCHRVVRGTGALGGYRWGLAVKEEMLGSERAAAEKAGKPGISRRKRAPRRAAGRD